MPETDPKQHVEPPTPAPATGQAKGVAYAVRTEQAAAAKAAPVSAQSAGRPADDPPASSTKAASPQQPLAGRRGEPRPLWPMLAMIAALAALAAGGLWYSSRPAPIPLQGTVEAEEVNVATKAFARVEELHVQEGERVTAGQTLAALSSPGLDLAVTQAQASLDTARAINAVVNAGARPEDIAALRAIAASTNAAADLAAVTARRMNRLHAEGVVSAQRRDEANAARSASAQNAAAADAQYRKALAGRRAETREAAGVQQAAAQDRLATAREMEREKTLTAPIDGEVSRRLAQPGEVVAPAVPVLQILDIAHMHVSLRIPETRLAGLARGHELSGSVPALENRRLRFRVSAISADAGFTSERPTRQSAGFDVRSFRVSLEPLEGRNELRPGMSVLFDWPQ